MSEHIARADDKRRDADFVKHFALMVEHLGRALTAIKGGNWDSVHSHLYEIRERSAFAQSALGGSYRPPHGILDAVRDQIPDEWAKAIVDALAVDRD